MKGRAAKSSDAYRVFFGQDAVLETARDEVFPVGG